jgi:predicted MFS family arabinose efflux permease
MVLSQGPEIEEKEAESKALYAMIAFGFGEVIGATSFGLIIDKIGSKKAVFVICSLIGLTTTITYLSILSLQYNFLTFLMCFAWGIQDGALNSHTFQMLGFEFES